MPFLTHDLPRGGRHVTPPTTAPGASARTRLRQLLPVGLLVAATGAGVVAAPVIGSTASVDGRHHDGGRAVTQAGPNTSPQAPSSEPILPQPVLPGAATAPAVTPGTDLVPAAYVVSAGKHRAAVVGEPLAASSGGKHRAGSGTHDQRAHTAKTTSTSTTTTPSAASTAAPTATSAPPASSNSSATSGTGAATAGTGSTSNGLVAGLVGTVTDVAGGLLGGTD